MPTPDFTTPHDADHSFADSDNKDWRGGHSLIDDMTRFVSYGNFAGPGNVVLGENPEAAAKVAADPHYDPLSDPAYANNPNYQPVDAMDAAAKQHDEDYSKATNGHNMFSWDGLKDYHDADAKLDSTVQTEMDANSSQYSSSAVGFSEGLRGFFGARVAGVDAVDFADKKASEAVSGVENFAKGAEQWSSVGDAATGMKDGAESAGSWLANTSEQAFSGAASFAKETASLGFDGAVGTAVGAADVIGAGAAHVAAEAGSEAWAGASSAASGIADGAASLVHGVEDWF